jgi:hypothetical protein
MTVTSATQTGYTQATNKTTATKATSAYENTAPVQTQQTDKMAEMQEKYKDVYTPIPETYSKADEDLQAQKIHDAYPNYLSGPEFLKIVDKYYYESGGEPFKLGTTPTQEQIEKGKEASAKALEQIGHTKESFIKMEKDVQAIKEKYPINNWAKEGVSNAKEIARFTNAAVYEGLESGKTVEEAKKYAGSIRDSYMNISGMPDTFLDTLVKAGRADPNAKQMDPDRFKPDFNSPINTIWDLRQYGIEGDWTKNNIYNNDKAMIAEIEKKINQFDFMLNNEKLIKEAYSKLKPEYQNLGNNAGYQQIINDEGMPKMQEGLNIFKNYKIYDSIDIKG